MTEEDAWDPLAHQLLSLVLRFATLTIGLVVLDHATFAWSKIAAGLLLALSPVALLCAAAQWWYPVGSRLLRWSKLVPTDVTCIRFRSVFTLLALSSLLLCMASAAWAIGRDYRIDAARAQLQLQLVPRREDCWKRLLKADAAARAAVDAESAWLRDHGVDQTFDTLSAEAMRAMDQDVKLATEVTKLDAQMAAPRPPDCAWVAGPAAILPVIWLMRWRWLQQQTAWRMRNGICVQCSYDLRASKERCPECGTPIPAQLATGSVGR